MSVGTPLKGHERRDRTQQQQQNYINCLLFADDIVLISNSEIKSLLDRSFQ